MMYYNDYYNNDNNDRNNYNTTKTTKTTNTTNTTNNNHNNHTNLFYSRKKDSGVEVLLGEAGVGKTCLAHGLAQRIVDGEVPYHYYN